jgi:hypothetical protein
VCGPTVMTVLPVAPPRPGARCCDSKQTSHPSSCARLARVCLSLTACKDNAVVCALLVGRWGGGGGGGGPCWLCGSGVCVQVLFGNMNSVKGV